MAGRRKEAEGLGIDIGASPGGRGLRTGPPLKGSGDFRMEPRSAFCLLARDTAAWFMLGWLWKRT